MSDTTFTLTDGVVSINLADGINYAIMARGYAPVVAGRRKGWIGVGPYEDVTETIRFDVFSAVSADDAYSKLAAVWALLDQAQRYNDGEPVAPVKAVYVLMDSTITGGTSTFILGNQSRLPTMALAATFNEQLQVWEITDNVVSFLRRGPRIATSDTVTFGVAVANPTVVSKTFSSAWAAACPISIAVSGFEAGAGVGAGTILCSGAGIEIYEAEGAALGTFTSVNDAANYARGNNVLRYSAPDTVERNSGLITTTTTWDRRVHIWAALRNTSGHQWSLRVVAYPSSAIDNYAFSRSVTLDTTDFTTPTIVYLGTIALDATFKHFRLYAQCLTFSGTPQLDIDYLVFAQASPELYAVRHGAVVFNGLPFPTNMELRVNANPLTKSRPSVTAYEDSGFTDNVIEALSRADVFISAQVVKLCWLTTSNTAWGHITAAARTANNFSVTRYRTYLTPR